MRAFVIVILGLILVLGVVSPALAYDVVAPPVTTPNPWPVTVVIDLPNDGDGFLGVVTGHGRIIRKEL